jgi:hypothetical protein
MKGHTNMGMKLDKDYNVNGHVFTAGDNVDTSYTDTDADGKTVKLDAAGAIKEMQQAEADAKDFGGHTEGVPTEADPNTPTSGTPTRPDGLGNTTKATGDRN